MPERKLFSSLFITEGVLVNVSALISLRFEVLMMVSIKKNKSFGMLCHVVC